MTTDHDLDRRIQDYLQAGPIELPDRVLWAARAQISQTRRRGRLDRILPSREIHMSQSTRLLLAGGGVLAVVVAIGAGFLGPFGPHQPGPGASQIVTPSIVSPAPSATSSAVSSESRTPAPTPSPSFTAPIVDRITPTVVNARWSVTAASLWTPYLAPDGRIWVPSNDADQIRIYDQTGRLVEKWGTSGNGDGQFFFGAPGDHRDGAGVVFAPDGTFYVLDSGNLRVQHFGTDRRFMGAFGSYGSEPGQFVSPVAIGLDDGGNLYVADQGRHDVQVFTTGGTYVRTIAKNGVGNGLWGSGPGWFITTRLIDNGSGAIEYHADGTVQGGWDFGPWNCDPSGVTRDHAPRNIYITCPSPDGGPGYLFRLDETGTLLKAWPIKGDGVAVSPDGTAAFVVGVDGTSLARYDLEPPQGG